MKSRPCSAQLGKGRVQPRRPSTVKSGPTGEAERQHLQGMERKALWPSMDTRTPRQAVVRAYFEFGAVAALIDRQERSPTHTLKVSVSAEIDSDVRRCAAVEDAKLGQRQSPWEVEAQTRNGG
ncbi:hypothetical protein JEQ12_001169 [Ovis aries]|uniref:Uncharacterized protein n=1 Tax=Ovis aries TaxID=9940 RepID=A0A836AJ95_SHEEP|nr:hypothetical protein JEQ12_001169 [Ovis aries]